MIVGGSGDQGADVVGVLDGQKWVLQSKFKLSGGVDSAGPREAVRAMGVYRADVGVAATNQYFLDDSFRYGETSRKSGIDLRLWDGRFLLSYVDRLQDLSAARPSLREYQMEAVDCAEQARSEGRHAGLILMATGLGKTTVAATLITNEIDRNPVSEILVLAHTVDLVRQFDRSIWSSLPKQVSTHLWAGGESPTYAGGVTVATWQSVSQAIETNAIEGRYSLIVVDEAHHAPAATYRHLVDSLAPNFLLGLTATPWRGDQQRVDEIFGPALFSMDIVDGMQRGYLAQVDYRMLVDDIDWDEVARLSREGLTIRDLNTRLVMPERDQSMVHEVASQMRGMVAPRALGFCRTIDHAERLRPLFSSHGIRCQVIHSRLSREERFSTLTQFRAGHIELLLSVEMLNEGIDVPDVNLVVFMRVTHSRRIFVQQLGRGLRLTPFKQTVRVLDFVADIRRIAAGLEMNQVARIRGRNPEVLHYKDGRVVNFSNERSESFIAEYASDIASLETLDDSARLRFPGD